MPRELISSKLGFYGLTDIPAEFQKAIDLTLTNCTNTYAYLDDTLIITIGSIEKHKEALEKVLRRLDEENFAITLDKCKFTFKQNEWLVFHIDCERINPLSRKTGAIEKLLPPKTLKQPKSFMGSIQLLTRYIPDLAHAAEAPRPPLLKNTDKHKTLNWSTKHDSAFHKIEKLETEVTQNKHFDQNLDTRVVCDASTYGLGADLEQNTKRGVGSHRVRIKFAGRISLEEKTQ